MPRQNSLTLALVNINTRTNAKTERLGRKQRKRQSVAAFLTVACKQTDMYRLLLLICSAKDECGCRDIPGFSSTLFCDRSTAECLQKETKNSRDLRQVTENTERRMNFFLWPLPCCDYTGGSYPAKPRCAFAVLNEFAYAAGGLFRLRMLRVGKQVKLFTQPGARP